ncbi:hypothetical protein RUM44_009391 [Polyplax serrata]|uniref:Uncharacterized protein n=1 Tax=Polyplax serrata TaxID=468196 RepID=A0ABR1ASJ5_POLSC
MLKVGCHNNTKGVGNMEYFKSKVRKTEKTPEPSGGRLFDKGNRMKSTNRQTPNEDKIKSRSRSWIRAGLGQRRYRGGRVEPKEDGKVDECKEEGKEEAKAWRL